MIAHQKTQHCHMRKHSAQYLRRYRLDKAGFPLPLGRRVKRKRPRISFLDTPLRQDTLRGRACSPAAERSQTGPRVGCGWSQWKKGPHWRGEHQPYPTEHQPHPTELLLVAFHGASKLSLCWPLEEPPPTHTERQLGKSAGQGRRQCSGSTPAAKGCSCPSPLTSGGMVIAFVPRVASPPTA